MTGFSLNELVPTWATATEILKGDVPGHEFHGNQWQQGYATALSEAGMNPTQVVTRGTDMGKLLNDMEETGASNGHGYFGVRGWEGPGDKGIVLGDKLLRDFAVKNSWQLHHVAAFADSKLGRHYGDFVVGENRATVREQASQVLENAARELGLPNGAT